MKKEKKKKIKILPIILILVLALIVFFAVRMYKNNTFSLKDNKIVATKTEEFNSSKIDIELEIKFKNYKVEKATKTIKYDSKKDAESEYKRYEAMNNFENQNLNLELKGKKLIIGMTEDYLRKDVNYKEQYDYNLLNPEDEIKTNISQEKLLNLLREQGYTIK